MAGGNYDETQSKQPNQAILRKPAGAVHALVPVAGYGSTKSSSQEPDYYTITVGEFAHALTDVDYQRVSGSMTDSILGPGESINPGKVQLLDVHHHYAGRELLHSLCIVHHER